MLADNIQTRDGTLYFAGHNTVQLAQKYGRSVGQICLRWSLRE